MGDFASDYDHTSPAFLAGMQRIGAQLREGCPLARGERFGGFWVLTRYDDVAAVLKDHGGFSPRDGVVLPGLDGAARAIPQEADPPEHSRYRAAFMRHLDKRVAARYEPEVREIVAARFDVIDGVEEPDLFSALAVPLPLTVSTRVLGLPREDETPLREIFLETVAAMATGQPEALAAVLPRFGGFLGERLAGKAADPADDLMSTLADPAHGFAVEEQIGLCVGFIMAGQDTTAMAIANLVLDVAEDRELRAMLVENPQSRPAAIEESLRCASPLQHLARTVTRPVELHGRTLEPGERIVVNLGAANRDPTRFPAAETFDPCRSPNRHLAFGTGIHHCAGIHIARQELTAVLDELLARMPDFELVGRPWRGLQMGTIYGPPQLRVRPVPIA